MSDGQRHRLDGKAGVTWCELPDGGMRFEFWGERREGEIPTPHTTLDFTAIEWCDLFVARSESGKTPDPRELQAVRAAVVHIHMGRPKPRFDVEE